MKISRTENLKTYNSGIQFGSAKKINLHYILEKHSGALPERVLNEVVKICNNNSKEKLPTLLEVHNKIYEPLIKSATLAQAKKLFSEFKDAIDLKNIPQLRSKAADAIKQWTPDSEFSLDFIKMLYAPVPMKDICAFYGVKNRSDYEYLAERLNIKKLSGAYLRLLKLSDPTSNAEFAEKSQQCLKTPEAIKKRLEKCAIAHRTPEYREKKRQEMKNFYKQNPEAAEKVRLITQMTWDRCPEIKTALSAYSEEQSPYVISLLKKRSTGAALNTQERRTLAGYYKKFWDTHPELKKLLSTRKQEVVEELNASNI